MTVRDHICVILDEEPNPKTGWIPVQTAADIVKLIEIGYTTERKGLPPIETPTFHEVEHELGILASDGLVLSKWIEFGPSVEPRKQRIYAWTAAVDHPGYQRWLDGGREQTLAALQEHVVAGEAILRGSS